MKTLEMEKAPASFRRAARYAKRGVLVLTEKGRPAFAVVGLKDDLALEALALRRNVEFMAYLEEISQRSRSEGTRSLRQIEEEFGGRPRWRPPGERRRRQPAAVASCRKSGR